MSIKSKLLASDVEKDVGRQVFEQHVLKNLMYTLSDEIDFIREKGVKLTEECLERFKPVSVDAAMRILETLLSRLNTIPYKETSEEVRLVIILLLQKLLKDYPESFKPSLSNVSDVLAKSLQDKFPEVKKESSLLVSMLCERMPEHIGLNARQIVKSLTINAKHQHSKIRKCTVALADILCVLHGGECFADAEQCIKLLLTDKSSDVRKQVYRLLAKCLKKFSYVDLTHHEVKLVKYLLSGFGEENLETRKEVGTLLNECGASRKKLEEERKAEFTS